MVSFFRSWLYGTLVVLGLVYWGNAIRELSIDSHLFLDPAYEEIWQDGTALQLKLDRAPSREELIEKYGEDAVIHHVDLIPKRTEASSRSLSSKRRAGLTMFSDDAFEFLTLRYFLSMKRDFELSDRETRKWMEIISAVLIVLFLALFLYPLILALIWVMKTLTWPFCREGERAQLRERYFKHQEKNSRKWSMATFLAVTAIAIGEMFTSAHAPLYREMNFPFGFIAASALMFYYASGIWSRLLVALLDALSLIRGRDPLQSRANELIALAITVPVLIFIFRNDWTSVAGTAVAGLLTPMLLKIGESSSDELASDLEKA